MAGATNRAFKAAGIPKAAQKAIRVAGGRGMTLRSAISLAEQHSIAIGDKPKAFLAKRDAKSAEGRKEALKQASAQRQTNLTKTLSGVAESMRSARRTEARRREDEVASMQAAFGKAKRADLAQRSTLDAGRTMMAKRKAGAAPSLDRSMKRYQDAAHKAFDAYYERMGFKTQKPPRLEFSVGEKYVRVTRVDDAGSKSAHSFIDKATGDIYKAESWKRAAKGVRGNIHRGEFGMNDSGAVHYSPAYEKRGTGPSKPVPKPKAAAMAVRAPAAGKASKSDRATIVAARLMAKGDLGQSFRSDNKALRRARAILDKYPEANGPARRLASELHFQKLQQNARRMGRDMTRRQYGQGPPAPETKRLIGMMR